MSPKNNSNASNVRNFVRNKNLRRKGKIQVDVVSLVSGARFPNSSEPEALFDLVSFGELHQSLLINDYFRDDFSVTSLLQENLAHFLLILGCCSLDATILKNFKLVTVIIKRKQVMSLLDKGILTWYLRRCLCWVTAEACVPAMKFFSWR